MATRFGVMRLEMLKVRNKESRQSRLLGDDLLELAPRQWMTRWVERQGVSLRVRGLSYRQSAQVLEGSGIAVSAMGIWRRVQARGKQRCRIEQAEQEQLFKRSVAPSATPPA